MHVVNYTDGEVRVPDTIVETLSEVSRARARGTTAAWWSRARRAQAVAERLAGDPQRLLAVYARLRDRDSSGEEYLTKLRLDMLCRVLHDQQGEEGLL